MSDNVFQFPGAKKPASETPAPKKRDSNIAFNLGAEYRVKLSVDNQLLIVYGMTEVIPEAYRAQVALNRPALPWEEALITCLYETVAQNHKLTSEFGAALLAKSPFISDKLLKEEKADVGVKTHGDVLEYIRGIIPAIVTDGHRGVSLWGTNVEPNEWHFNDMTYVVYGLSGECTHAIGVSAHDDGTATFTFIVEDSIDESRLSAMSREVVLPEYKDGTYQHDPVILQPLVDTIKHFIETKEVI